LSPFLTRSTGVSQDSFIGITIVFSSNLNRTHSTKTFGKKKLFIVDVRFGIAFIKIHDFFARCRQNLNTKAPPQSAQSPQRSAAVCGLWVQGGGAHALSWGRTAPYQGDYVQ